MLGGLQDRRIAICATRGSDALRDAFEASGAKVEVLANGGMRSPDDWHSGNYAALVIGECEGEGRSRAVQLTREFLVAQKPIGVLPGGESLLQEAGGQAEDVVFSPATGAGNDADAMATRLANHMDESQVDEMSDLSFPASDPPAVSPSTIGPDRNGAHRDARG